MEKVELVAITAPLMGHLPPVLQLAKLMLQTNNQLSITFLISKMPLDPEGAAKIQSIVASNSNIERLHFQELPTDQVNVSQGSNARSGSSIHQFIESQKIRVREAVSKIEGLSGFIVDMISTTMIDVADDLGLPSYLFFNQGAGFIGLLLHFQTLEDEQNQEISELIQSRDELDVPSYEKRVPIGVLPTLTTKKETWSKMFLKCSREYRRAKGIVVNTFADLETYALDSFSLKSPPPYGNSKVPTIYPLGPILNLSQSNKEQHPELMNWLDSQPQNSVVFLCFGSMGSINSDQIKEIAKGIEQSGCRFLWVLRQADKGGFAGDLKNYEAALPDGFLGRTASIGKVVGWVPQVAVLSHPAVGGFVSHCGWNSTLESIWFGVPMATWPLHAEQQLNAFQLVKELGIAVEIALDYAEAKQNQEIVRAKQVEKGIRELMDSENEVRKRVKEFSEKSHLAVEENGSSTLALETIIQDLIHNSSQGQIPKK
ncbi:hypothetical protein ACH5RR_001561 [Cinchona calisaya]|uniref:Glycosyltransferase n=1 Tax=Cinchona calisaya TaxID=153742 RepID=A0ABD3B3U9_9GENT